MDLKSAAWDVMPTGAGVNSIELSVSDPTGQVQLAGSGRPDMSSFKLQALARNVQIASLGRFIPALRPVGGVAFVNGSLNGSLARPVFDGDVQALGVTYSGMKFDRIHGGVSLSPSGAQLRDITMHIFPGEIVLNGSVSMDNYHPTDTNIQIAARDLSLSRLTSLQGMKLPVTGNASGNIAIQGPPTHPLIAGRLNVMNGVLGTYPVSTATAEFRYEPDLQQFHSGVSPVTLLAGLELTSVTASSPDATFTLTGGRIDQNGRLNMHADLTNIAFIDLWESLAGKQEGSPQILPLENGRVALQVSGTVNRPRLVAQLPPTQVDVNGQRMVISAQNLSVVPQLSPPADAAHKSSFSLASLSVDQIVLQHLDLSGAPSGSIRIIGPAPGQTAVLLPHVAAVAEISQMSMDTAAGLVRQSLPRGVSGMISGGRLDLSGDLPIPNTTGEPLQLLKGTASLTLRDVALVPPSSGPIIPIPYNVPPAPGSGQPSAPVPSRTVAAANPPGAHTTLAAFRLFGGRKKRLKPPVAPGPIAPPIPTSPVSVPTPAGVHFAIGQFNARLEGKRVTLDVAHLYQFDNNTAPGIRLEVAPGSYYDVGGGMSVTAEAPGIPVALVNELFPLFAPPKSDTAAAGTSTSQFTDLVNRVGGSVHLAAQVTQATEDLTGRVLTLSIDPSIADPLMYSGRPLLARAVVQATEGSLALRSLALGTRIGTAEHLVTGSGSIPFTWKGANHIPANGAIDFHAQLANDNLSALQALAPEMVQSATGSLTAAITVNGTLQTPRVFGAVLVGDTTPGKLVLQHIEQPLQNVRLAVNFDDQQATVTGSASSDKGTMTLGGTAKIPGANRPGTVALTFKTVGFHLTDQGLYADSAYRGETPNPQQLKKYYEQVYGLVDSAITVNGPLFRPLVSGDITIRNADLRYGGSPEIATPHTSTYSINPRFRINLTLGQPGLMGKDVSVIHTSLAKINPYGTLKVTGDLEHPVMDGDVNIRKGGYLNYVLALWQIESATAHVHYEPPLAPGENGLKLNVSGVLKTEVEDQGGGKTTAFFAPAGQLLSVRMQVIGDPMVQGGFHVQLTSDPPRTDAQLRALLFHTDILQNLQAGNLEGQVPGLFNEALRNTLLGNVINPLESKVAGFLGLEEVNLQYQFGGPLFLQISKHWFDGVSIRFRRELTAGTSEYQAYLD
ncbi:MAG: translocation/assembly module TamB domain-containing protein, partial [Armatimonadota bacterium]|nr:translocation/assembly module TamB domain-containing protein [Armatimonadota bacterium]